MRYILASPWKRVFRVRNLHHAHHGLGSVVWLPESELIGGAVPTRRPRQCLARSTYAVRFTARGGSMIGLGREMAITRSCACRKCATRHFEGGIASERAADIGAAQEVPVRGSAKPLSPTPVRPSSLSTGSSPRGYRADEDSAAAQGPVASESSQDSDLPATVRANAARAAPPWPVQ
jgi:hypothetical protein